MPGDYETLVSAATASLAGISTRTTVFISCLRPSGEGEVAMRWSILIVAAWVLASPACANRSGSSTGASRPATAARDGILPVRMSPVPLEFELNQHVWHEQNVGTSSNPDVVCARSFVRDKAAEAAQCPADLVVVGERVAPGENVALFSAAKRFGMPPATIESVFSWQDGPIQLVNAVGYRLRGEFGCGPVAYMVYALEGGYGISITIEINPHDYAAIEKEILAILRSFRTISPG